MGLEMPNDCADIVYTWFNQIDLLGVSSNDLPKKQIVEHVPGICPPFFKGMIASQELVLNRSYVLIIVKKIGFWALQCSSLPSRLCPVKVLISKERIDDIFADPTMVKVLRVLYLNLMKTDVYIRVGNLDCNPVTRLVNAAVAELSALSFMASK